MADTDGLTPVDLAATEAPSPSAHAAPSASASAMDEEEADGLMSGLKVELINWHEKARPAECVLLALSLTLLMLSLGGSDWLSGMAHTGKIVRVGLDVFIDGDAEPVVLHPMCIPPLPPPPPEEEGAAAAANATAAAPAVPTVACALAAAGGGAASVGWLAFAAGLVIALTYALDALHARGVLTPLRAKIPPSVPLDALLLYVPLACWCLLLVLTYVALLLYASRAPPSLGGGPTRLGASYGLGRLSLLTSLLGLLVHGTLVHRLGEDPMVTALDAARNAWAPLVPRQKLLVLLLLVGLVCELLRWLRRAEYGFILMLYGLSSYVSHAHDHLCAFCMLALLSVGTDSLALAFDDGLNYGLVPGATWGVLVCKLTAVGMLIHYKDAFA